MNNQNARPRFSLGLGIGTYLKRRYAEYLTWAPGQTGTQSRRLVLKREKLAGKEASLDRFAQDLKSLRPGDVVLDCGANMGEVTAELANTGADVHAYEPDPSLAERLQERFKGVSNVFVHQAAVSNKDGFIEFFKQSDFDPTVQNRNWGGSLYAAKPDVDPALSVQVKVENIFDIIESYGKNLKFIKMDIEGAEFDILEEIVAKDMLEDVPHIFVETHEGVFYERIDLVWRLRQFLRNRNSSKIDFHWP